MKQKPKIEPHPIARVATAMLAAMTRHPAELQLKDTLIGSLLVIEIEAHQDDRPKLIGSQGKHIAAFTRVMKAMGGRYGVEVVVDLIVPRQPVAHVPHQPFEPNPTWHANQIRPLIHTVCDALLFRGWKLSEHDLKNTTVFQLDWPGNQIGSDIVAALNVLFEAIGYKQGRVVRITARPTP